MCQTENEAILTKRDLIAALVAVGDLDDEVKLININDPREDEDAAIVIRNVDSAMVGMAYICFDGPDAVEEDGDEI